MAREPFSARLTCIWAGAFFFFMLTGFRGGIRKQLNTGYENRNFWAGYLLSLLLLTTIICGVFFCH